MQVYEPFLLLPVLTTVRRLCLALSRGLFLTLATLCVILSGTANAYDNREGFRQELLSSGDHLNVLMNVADARHLLERAGIGAHPEEVRSFVGVSRLDGIMRMIDQLDVRQTLLQPPSSVADAYHDNWAVGDMESEERQAFRNARDKEMGQLRQWWIREILSTDRPAGERLMLIWHNHFVTAYSSVNEAVRAVYRQHEMLRDLGDGDLRSLLKAVVRDAAMLNYLDNDNNRKNSPNENLARELMELFTLGEGNYTENDVREVARALTGFSFNDLRDFEFRFEPQQHDTGFKQILGQRGRFDPDELIDLLLEQSATAEFLTKKFWAAYVSDFYDDPVAKDAIAQSFRNSNYDIRTLVGMTLASEAFWLPEVRGTLIKSPVDLILGSIRTSGQLPDWWGSSDSRMASLGQNLFEAPNVAGWPGGADWITPARLKLRQEMLLDFDRLADAGSPVMVVPRVMGGNDTADPKAIEVRYASEDFEGPSEFFVTAYRMINDRKTYQWRSPLIQARGGIDTGRYGRIESAADLNWMVETIALPEGLEAPDNFSITFTNDHCCGAGGSDGGDRNFFVDWLRFDDRVYLAANGSQRTCSGGQERLGEMYCNGTLNLSDFNPMEPETGSVEMEPNILYVERVLFDWGQVRDPSRGWNGFAMTLRGVRFNDLEVEALRIEFVSSKNNNLRDYELVLHDDGCYPTCLGVEMPPGAQRDYRNEKTMMRFPLRSNGQRHYYLLGAEQRELINALWQHLPTLYEQMQLGRNWQRRGERRLGDGWDADIASTARALPNTRYRGDSDLVFRPFDGDSGMSMSMMMADTDRDREVYLSTMDNWDVVTSDWPHKDRLASVLVTTEAGLSSSGVGFYDLIQHPLYQLK